LRFSFEAFKAAIGCDIDFVQKDISRWTESVLRETSFKTKESSSLWSGSFMDVNWPLRCGPVPILTFRGAVPKRPRSAEVFF
jgi:hypothetical protein